MILPERVFGRPGAHWMKSSEAIGLELAHLVQVLRFDSVIGPSPER